MEFFVRGFIVLCVCTIAAFAQPFMGMLGKFIISIKNYYELIFVLLCFYFLSFGAIGHLQI